MKKQIKVATPAVLEQKIDLLETPLWPKITVVTPSYNQGQFIEYTIQSVLNQEYPNLEYIIVDGASTDQTLAVVENYRADIHTIISEKDKGQSDAINKGFALATGDILCWLNSDDCFSQGTLHRVAAHFRTYSPDYRMLLYGQGKYLLDKCGILLTNYTSRLSDRYPIAFCDFIIQPSTFWGRSVWDEIGLLRVDLHYCFDWEWFIRAYNKNVPFIRSDEYFSIYRIHSEHKTSNAGQKRINELAEFCGSLHGSNVKETYLKLNSSAMRIRLRRLIRRLPKNMNFVSKVYWKVYYRELISFDSFYLLLAAP